MATVEVAADEYAQAGAATPAPLLVDLQHHAIEHDGVIAGDAARFLVAEDLVQVMPAHRHEGAAGISRGAAEAGVVVGNEALAQIAVGGSEGPDPGDPQLTRRPCRVPLARSLRPRAWGEKLTMCSMPSRAKARPTWVSFVRSGLVPDVGV
jgi:hypothetical protein